MKEKRGASSEADVAATEFVTAVVESQKELRKNQQVFLSNLIKEQHLHTHSLVQSQMEFPEKFF